MRQNVKSLVTESSQYSDGLKLWIALIRCSNQLERTIDKKFRHRYGQSISRFDVLSQLERKLNHGLTVGELGQQLIAVKGNITGLVNRMTADDLLTKTSMTNDRRCNQVMISKKGLDLYKQMADSQGEWIMEYFQSIGSRDMKTMTELLSIIRTTHVNHKNNEKANDIK